MEPITYSQLKTNIEIIQRIEQFRIVQSMNDHASLFLSGIIDEKYKDDYVKEMAEGKVIEIYTEEDSTRLTLFKGMLKSECVKFVQGVYYLELEGISFSFLLDIKKKNRSFQDTTLTYYELVKGIVKLYTDGDVQDTASGGAGIGQLLVQYEETDWQFIKRLASHFHKGIIPMITYDGPKIVFGTKAGKNIGKIEDFNYYVSKNIEKYLKLKNDKLPELNQTDVMTYHVETTKVYDIGDEVIYQEQKLFIRKKECEMINSTVYFRYELTSLQGFLQEEVYNENLVGVSIQGTVIDRVSDRVKVKLAIDDNQVKENAWEFPYTTIYSAEGNTGWYCMPEIGDTVNIYFPEKEEQYAVGMNSIRVNTTEEDKVSNPDVKYFRTADGKELKFTEEEICITCCDGKDAKSKKEIYIKLNHSDGIEIVSTEPINFISGKDISLQADNNIKILASDEIQLSCKTSEITINSKIDICGKDVRIN